MRLASVRRSLFAGEAERAKFLNHLAAGTRDILRTQRRLEEHANYHEFCRLLGRLKTNYQLSELVRTVLVVSWPCNRTHGRHSLTAVTPALVAAL